MIRVIYFLILITVSAQAQSVKERGGGNSLVCFSSSEAAEKVKARIEDRVLPEIENSLVSIQILDLAEAQSPRGATGEILSVVPSRVGENPDDYVARIAKRFDGNIPQFAKFIRDGQKRFRKLAIQRSQKPISPINDIGITRIDVDSKCVIMTMMEQRIQNGFEVMWIDQWLLDHVKHSATSRGVAFLHEYIYAEARAQLKHSTSEATREAVGLSIFQNADLSVFEIQKQLHTLGFINTTNERQFANEKELEQFVLDQKILSEGLSSSEPLTMAHKQVEEIIRQWAVTINHAVNESELANSYRNKISELYQQAFRIDLMNDKILSPVLGACRVTGTEASAPLSLEPIDMAACSYLLLSQGGRALFTNGNHLRSLDRFEQQRLKIYLDMSSDLTELGNQFAKNESAHFKTRFRPLLQKISGVSPEAIEKALDQIIQSVKLSAYARPATYLPEEKDGALFYRGPVAYIVSISKRAETILRLSEYNLLQHPLPNF